jgi:two-component system alkaline phosphatase synthesis response regulator PhoP
MTIKVLVVDDEDDVRRLIQTKLKKAGFEVIAAVNGEEGVEICKQEKPDVVIMDWMMPKMDGPTAMAKIKAECHPNPLILMLTAKGTEQDVITGLGSGADDYIVKPFAPRELIARVNVALVKAGRQPLIGS